LNFDSLEFDGWGPLASDYQVFPGDRVALLMNLLHSVYAFLILLKLLGDLPGLGDILGYVHDF
jgi:hypothetical protein